MASAHTLTKSHDLRHRDNPRKPLPETIAIKRFQLIIPMLRDEERIINAD